MRLETAVGLFYATSFVTGLKHGTDRGQRNSGIGTFSGFKVEEVSTQNHNYDS